ncbi:hypothetical protein KFK09_019419 [Dendrobium nobile]|uniref:Uncharacterized protein n=1 Tax=Dendrobium nobile TaxID=94219 RepID=A0A8T3AR06_DENNO|nr:hypothetical protein KFK09_019419 [Dendrobium nobile]
MATALFFFTPSSSVISFPPQNPNLNNLLTRSSPLAIPVSANPNVIPRSRSAVPFLSAKALRTTVPTIPVEGELLDISKIGISEQIVTALSHRGITELFPIQRAVLEPAMEGRDMIGRAITGSGKTLAFGIPILDKIIRDQTQSWKKRVPSALVLAPTRELARQVQREFKISAPNLQSTCIYGGIPIMSQVRALGYGMDIVVGTPGRIIDLFERGALDLSEVKFVVLDEADQMLAVGFQEDVERILSYLPRKKQCMLFSATMPQWIHDLSRKYLRDPVVVDLVGDSDQKLAEGISLYSVSSTSPNKQNLLPTLISMYAQGGKSIIFTKTKRDAESLSRSMGVVIGSKALHGDMQQSQRDKTLAAFRDGRFRALVATDVAARGLDIPNVDLVIHFEIPNTPDIFLHRSGRTGRAGNKGTTVLMFTEGQRRTVRSIEHDLGCKFEELRGITGEGGKRTSDKYDDNSWLSEDGSDDNAQYGNYRRSPKSNNYKSSESNFRSQSYYSDNSRYGNNERFKKFNSIGNSQDYSRNQSPESDNSQYENHGRFRKLNSNGISQNSFRNQSHDSVHAQYGNNGRFRSQGSPRKNKFSKPYQSVLDQNSTNRSSFSLDSLDHWNESNTDENFDFPAESTRSKRTYGSRKHHQKKSETDNDNFDSLFDLF